MTRVRTEREQERQGIKFVVPRNQLINKWSLILYRWKTDLLTSDNGLRWTVVAITTSDISGSLSAEILFRGHPDKTFFALTAHLSPYPFLFKAFNCI